jgi:hypothetical protein
MVVCEEISLRCAAQPILFTINLLDKVDVERLCKPYQLILGKTIYIWYIIAHRYIPSDNTFRNSENI